jgi:hypothetical protein
LVFAASLAALGGCSGAPAAKDPPVELPQVRNQGGRVIAHVKLVTITFEDYPFQDQVQAFGDWIVSSSWLETVGREYGVASGTQIAKFVLQYTPPPVVSARDIETYLSVGIESGVFPKPDPDTLYVIYYPATTRPDGLGCDGAWWGHNEVATPIRFTYAAIPTCPPPALYGWTQIQSIEQDASHEIIEALTDPDPAAPTYAITDPLDAFHYMGTEIGDLCVGQTVEEAGFTAQRVWSNAEATAGRSPCIPAPEGDVFFGALPMAPGAIPIAAGGQADVALSGWATSPRPSWSIAAIPFPAGGYGGTVAPTGTLDRTTLGAGDRATLTLSVPSGAKSGSRGILLVDSLTVGMDGVATSGPYEWPILVLVR